MVGYHSIGAFKLYDPNSKKIVFSKDVKFDKTKCWNWKDKASNKFDSHFYLSDSEKEEVETEEQEEIVEDTNEGGAGVSNRPTRNTQPQIRLRDYERFPDQAVTIEGDFVQLAMLGEAEPVSFRQALKQKHWKKEMIEELDSIKKNETWRSVQLPIDKNCIDVKWVFKTKLKPNDQVAKYKARLVARGFLQKYGQDYYEVYAPVARMETIRLIVAIAVKNNLSMYQLDVKSTFLNGELEEEVYVNQPPGFEIKGKEEYVYKLDKALYGLKQAPRA